MPWSDLPPRSGPGLVAATASAVVLWLPAALLAVAAHRADSTPLAVGAAVHVLFGFILARQQPVWRPPVGASVVVLYLVALGWCWVATRGTADPIALAIQGTLLVAAVGLFAAHDLIRTGAEPLRKANKCARRLTARTVWPAPLADCRHLPEVRGLRDATQVVAGPALVLMSDPRPEVQVAALCALEFRPHWRPGEAEMVLRTAQTASDAAVRAAAAYALAGVRGAELVGGLAGLLRDRAPEVRRAAAEALLWDGDERWPFARSAVHAALSEPKLAADGPLFVGAARLPAAAVVDLSTWAGDRPPLAGRAAETLIDHYDRGLSDPDRPELASELAAQVLSPETAAGLRVELAALLRDHHLLTPDLLDRFTNADQPGPLRLLAAEVMLRANPTDPDGLDVLRGLARQPNRELALAVGAILQNIIGLPLGLPPGQVPAAKSKMAVDIARRVLAWANGASPDEVRPPTPGAPPAMGVKIGSRPPFAGLQATYIAPQPTRKARHET